MKRIISLILCLIFTFSITATVFSRESGNAANPPQNAEITGLQESLDNLWLVNHLSQAEMDAMTAKWESKFTEDFWFMPWEIRRDFEWRLIKYADPEEELAYRLEQRRPIFSDGLLVSTIRTAKYSREYAENGRFDYLINSNKYWCARGSVGWVPFSLDGEIDNRGYFVVSQEDIDFLRDVANISKMLSEKGVTQVHDARLLGFDASMLYLTCDNGDYFIRLSSFFEDTTIGRIKDLVNKSIYSLDEFTGIIESFYNVHQADSFYGKEGLEDMLAPKPTYAAEGAELMAEGVIAGNEKGLDPLKPLTRLEAITILVNAFGYGDEPAAEASEFIDISNDSWGKKYANIAKAKGISNGVGGGKFAPDELVTSTQFAALLLRDSEPAEFDWQQAINMLIERGIITQEESETMDLFTRGDMAKIIYEARAKGLI